MGKKAIKIISSRRHGQATSIARLLPILFLGSVLIIWLQVDWVRTNSERFTHPAVSRLFKYLYRIRPVTVTCSTCDGTGLVTNRNGLVDMCPVCYGLGQHKVRPLLEDDAICPTCQGMGRVYNPGTGTADFCPTCQGRGLVKSRLAQAQDDHPIHVLQIECDHCEGKGMARNDDTRQLELCPICQGTGYHWVRKMNADEDICPACGGMGRLLDPDTGEPRVCRRCLGRGLITLKPGTPRHSTTDDRN
jgi:hypothetical protein